MAREPFLHHIVLCRHGETAWTLSGQHTGTTDLPLTPHGVEQAEALRPLLSRFTFAQVWSSPLERARHTCESAGQGAHMQVIDDLREWDYGSYEGRTTPEIREEVPNWNVFTHGAPEGESVADAAGRADRLIAQIYDVPGDLLIFSHGHFSRVLATRWLEIEMVCGRHFDLWPSSLSILGYNREVPVFKLWNGRPLD